MIHLSRRRLFLVGTAVLMLAAAVWWNASRHGGVSRYVRGPAEPVRDRLPEPSVPPPAAFRGPVK